MSSTTIVKRKKRTLIIILIVVNFLLIEVASELGLFKGERKYITFPISVFLSLTIVALAVRYKLASWKVFILYGIIAAALLGFQFVNF